MIAQIMMETANVTKHIRDTARHVSNLELGQAAQSYAKSVPGTFVLGKMSPQLVKLGGSKFIYTQGGKILGSTIQSVGKGVKSFSNWWLTPVKSGVTKYSTIAKSKGVMPLAKTSGIAGAILVGDHLVAKVAKSPSIIDVGISTISNKHGKKVADRSSQEKNFFQNTLSLATGGFAKEAALKVVNKIKGGSKR